MLTNFHVQLDEQNFQSSLEISLQTPLLVYFWANMAAESVALKQQLTDLAMEYQGAFVLASLDCEQYQMLAGQFGVQSVPTLVLFNQGRPVAGLDAMQVQQPIDISMVKQMLGQHISLPDPSMLAFNQARELMQAGEFNQALTALKLLATELSDLAEYKLALAECYIETNQFSEAEAQLNTVLMQDQDSLYKSLLAKVELHNQAADSDEIRHLQQAFAEDETNAELGFELAIQLNQIHQQEQALDILVGILQKDLNFAEGKAKKTMLDILAALGQGNELASRYRRKLYALLY